MAALIVVMPRVAAQQTPQGRGGGRGQGPGTFPAQQRPPGDPAIIERGPYRLTRNPMYLQMVVACIGVAIAFANTWILLLVPVCAWALQALAIIPEEQYLERKFGEHYLAYKKRVRRWI